MASKLNSFMTRFLNHSEAPGGISGTRPDRIKWRPLLVELFVALSLCAAYFFLVRNYYTGSDPMNSYIFVAGSEKCYELDQPIMGAHWNGRVAGLLLSGALIDFSLKEHSVTTEQIERLKNVFGLYHAFWLLLLFLAVIFALRHSLFINLGIFAGLIYDFSPASGPFFYPWDMPATLFFTLAVLFFERRQMWLLVAAICAGSFFKETVLVCALLVFFADHWKWKKRILAFIGIVAMYALGQKLLLSQLHIEAPLLSASDAVSLRGAFSPVTILDNLMENLKTLFSPTLNSVIFANAGTLAAVLVLGWRRRFLPYMTVILTFLAGLFLIAAPPGISEVRDFMEILPLSLILLNEWWLEHAGTGTTGEWSAGLAPVWAVRGTFSLLIPLTIVLIGLCTSAAAWQYYIIVEDLRPERQAQSRLGKFAITLTGDVNDVAVENQLLRSQYVKDELELAQVSVDNWHFSDAIHHYRRVLELDTNSVIALNNLAWLLATASDPGLRNGKEAVRLAERACQLTQNKNAALGYTLAAAYAEAGRFADAVATAQKAREVALEQGLNEIVARNEPLLELYKSGRAYHHEAKPAR